MLISLSGRKERIKEHKWLTQYSQNYPIYKDDTTIAMRKGFDGGQIITVLSNLGAGGAEYSASIPDTGFAAGEELTEVVSCASVTAGDSGEVSVAMAGGEPRILLPISLLEGSTLCSS